MLLQLELPTDTAQPVSAHGNERLGVTQSNHQANWRRLGRFHGQSKTTVLEAGAVFRRPLGNGPGPRRKQFASGRMHVVRDGRNAPAFYRRTSGLRTYIRGGRPRTPNASGLSEKPRPRMRRRTRRLARARREIASATRGTKIGAGRRPVGGSVVLHTRGSRLRLILEGESESRKRVGRKNVKGVARYG